MSHGVGRRAHVNLEDIMIEAGINTRWSRMVVLALCLALMPPVALAQSLVTVTADVVYGHKDGMALTFDVFTPARPNGAAVLHIVSGGWVSRWSPPAQVPPNIQGFYQPLFEKGFTVFAVRHGSSPRYVIPEIVPDLHRAVRFIRMTASRY